MTSDPNRKFKLRAERVLSGRKVPTPSQKKSESNRKKLNRRSSEQPVHYKYSCHTCTKACGLTMKTCSELHVISRCKQCGAHVIHHGDPELPLNYCDDCQRDDHK